MFEIDNILKNQVISGEIPVSDLELCRTANGRDWQMRQKSEGKEAISGENVQQLLKASANGLSVPKGLEEAQGLLKDQQFRRFSREIPGIESESKRRIRIVKKRILEGAKIVGAGLTQVSEKHSPKLVGEIYWLREIALRESGFSAMPLGGIEKFWKESESNLSIHEWLEGKEMEWSEAKTDQSFISWLSENGWKDQLNSQWKKSGTPKPFDEWVQEQYDKSPLAEPLFEVQKKYEERRDKGQSFDEWCQETTLERQKFLKKMREDSEGLLDYNEKADFNKIDQYIHSWEVSGRPFDLTLFVAKQFWLATNPEDKSDKAFEEFAEKKRFKSAESKLSFSEWKERNKNIEKERWKGTHLPLSFEKWKAQQNADPLKPVPFIRLSAKEREIYRCSMVEGHCYRNNHPYVTAHECTAHSGAGYAIFVIAPDETLYSGSHIAGVFHHSSFLGDGATIGAGEIKTDETGKITQISSKSGHYQPGVDQNVFILNFFKDKGVDLNKIDFTYFKGPGEEETVNAQAYLNDHQC